MKVDSRHLKIRHLGPIKESDIELGQVNLIIGLQGSGKSCVLKTACFCAWVEKRLELTQGANGFSKGSTFIDMLADYYKMQEYVWPDTYIEYETKHVKFQYDHAQQKFLFSWKSGHWNYKRAKVSYIPADRNIVAAIPQWSKLSLDRNLLDFMASWDVSRKAVGREEDVLGLGLTYSFDKATNTDRIMLLNGRGLQLTASSSGIQSLLPMFIHLDYLTKGQYNKNESLQTFEEKEESRRLVSLIYKNVIGERKDSSNVESNTEPVTIAGYDYLFAEKKEADSFQRKCKNYLYTNHSEIFVEEPEDNLFPSTQCQLVNWILEATKKHKDLLFMATHSPYVLNQLLKEQPDGLEVYFTYPMEDGFNVRHLTKEDVRLIYADGVDLFFNFEPFV